MSISPQWGNASYANLIKHERSECEGYAVKLKPEKLANLEGKIGVPKNYNRIKVQIKIYPGEKLVDGDAHVVADKSQFKKFVSPIQDHLDNISKTLSAGVYLREGPFEDNVKPIKFKVHKHHNLDLDKVIDTFASMKYLGI